MTYVTKHLDWLAFTLPITSHLQEQLPFFSLRYVGRGHHGYNAAYHDGCYGASVETDPHNPEMGSHIRFSGSALAVLRERHGGSEADLLARILHLKAKATRIDLALNIHAGTLAVPTLYSAIREGRATTKAHSWRMVNGKRDQLEGATLYLGSPQSDVQLRCYDKNAEQGIVDHDAWIRFELELRRRPANNAFIDCCSSGISPVVTGHIADFVQFDHPDFALANSGESRTPRQLDKRVSNRERWLLGQVVQALAKESTINPSVLERFNRALAAELVRLSIEANNSKPS